MGTAAPELVIIGGGAAGITVASLVRKHRKHWRVTVIEPSENHYYQPGFTIVGGGAYPMHKTVRPTAKLIPRGVTWLKTRANHIDPRSHKVTTESGKDLHYDYLVVCPGLVNDIDRVTGLSEALGKSGVTSNYVTGMAPYTWQLINAWSGGRAVFTQPPVPFKCPGAPQKIAYLAADRWRRRGILSRSEVHFFTAAPAMFGIPDFSRVLDKVVERYGIDPHFQYNLVEVDGRRRAATFEKVGTQDQFVDVEYDLLHVTPPEVPPSFLKESNLVNASGYVEVDQSKMQHAKFPNVFALGDIASTPNSKTAAAIRKQAPILVSNLIAYSEGRVLDRVYDGYGSCPLTTSLNTVLLAEFAYGGKVTPTFHMDPFVERRLWWFGKVYGFPALYWRMLRGLEFDVPHTVENAQPYMAT